MARASARSRSRCTGLTLLTASRKLSGGSLRAPGRVIVVAMATLTKRPYGGVPGFDVSDDIAAPNSVPGPTRSLRKNHELVQDLCRYAENLASESAVRKKWRLSEETWELLGADDELVRAVEEERTRRVRSGATKRELAQQHVVRGPGVLASIMDDPRANARHRVDSIKTLNAIADPGPEAAVEQERIIIKIDLSADTKAKGLEPRPDDILIYDVPARPNPPQELLPPRKDDGNGPV